MKDNKTTYRQKDELAEMFSKRNRNREAQTTVTRQRPEAPEQKAAQVRRSAPLAPVQKRKAKKQSSQLNSTIIGGVIIALVVLCIIIGIVLLTSGGKKIEAIKFSSSVITMKIGENRAVPIVTEPAGMEKEVTIEVSGRAVRLEKDGTITAISGGDGVITAKYGELTASCDIIVERPELAKALSIDKDVMEIAIGGGYKPIVTATPETAVIELQWASSDENIVKVSADGEITGTGEGTAEITATDKNSGLSVKLSVSVMGAVYPESMKFSEEKITLEIGQEYNSELIMTPGNITDKEAIYYTTDLEIASVTNEGLITAKSVGTCTIEAYYARDNTVVAYIEVTVIDPFVITEKPEENSKPEEDTSSGGTSSENSSGDESDNSSEASKPVNGIEVIDGITYVQGILIANKTYALPSIYNPGTDDEAYNALDEMQTAAAQEGLILYVLSGFRDYDTQASIYNRYVSNDGKANADRYSARPGHSEHQTGLAFDLNSLEESFADTREGKWLAANAHKYGFIIRYPKGKEHITGYMYEPWHVRYLGKDIATKVYNSGLTLEEYLGITSEYQD